MMDITILIAGGIIIGLGLTLKFIGNVKSFMKGIAISAIIMIV